LKHAYITITASVLDYLYTICTHSYPDLSTLSYTTLFRSRGSGPLRGDEHGGPAGEVLEILGQRVQVQVPSVSGQLAEVELGVPVVAEVAAVDEGEGGGAVSARGDQVLEGVEGPVLGLWSAHGQALVLLGLDHHPLHRLVGVWGPGGPTLLGGDSVPHLLRGRLQDGLLADLEVLGHGSAPQGVGSGPAGGCGTARGSSRRSGRDRPVGKMHSGSPDRPYTSDRAS